VGLNRIKTLLSLPGPEQNRWFQALNGKICDKLPAVELIGGIDDEICFGSIVQLYTGSRLYRINHRLKGVLFGSMARIKEEI